MNEGQMIVEVATLNAQMETIATEVVAETAPTVVVVSETVPLVSETVAPTVVESPVDVVAATILAETPVKKGKKEKAKRKPGRPRLYNGTDRRIVGCT